jgi:hypothetical protein
MRVTSFLCRLHRNSFRYTGRISDAGRHNQDIGVMLFMPMSVELQRKVSHYLQPILSHRFLNNLA